MVRVVCEECDNESSFDCGELDWEWGVHDPDRQMGAEHVYTATWESECEGCNAAHEVTFRVYEYPVGAVNMTEVDSSGCTIDGGCLPDLNSPEEE